MRVGLILVSLSFVCLSIACFAQSTSAPATTSDPQAVALLQKSLAAMTGGAAVTDVALTGSVTTTFEAKTDAGTVTMIGTSSGRSEVSMAVTSGTQTTIQDFSGSAPRLVVTGTDGVSHAVQPSSALTPYPAWFYPPFLFAAVLSSQYVASYVGHETWNGAPVEHIAVWRTNNALAQSSVQLERATRQDIYLDSTSLLPVATSYLVRPYYRDDPGKPILPYKGNSPDHPVTIQYTQYSRIQGQLIPMQLRLNVKTVPSETTDDFLSIFQISVVNFNTGATITVPATAN